MKYPALILKILVALAVLSIPLLGIWVASSMAAYGDGPIWTTLAAGLLAFPILPAAWDLLAMRRRVKKGQKVEDRVLKSGDRLLLRTFAINALFLVALPPFAIAQRLFDRRTAGWQTPPEALPAADDRPTQAELLDALRRPY